jgi:hypothetical protein
MRQRLFLFSLFLSLNNGIFAQSNTFKISGKVVDEDNIPLEFVTVYINSSSIFTQTDSLGSFTLNIPSNKIDFELVVSMVGFTIQKQKFTRYTVPKFLMVKLASNSLNEVIIKAKQDRYWSRKWQVFRNGLLGENQFARQCSFENKENIHLSLDYRKKTVFANSSKTFVVINKALGYKIHIDLHSFSSDGVKTNYAASKFYEDNLAMEENKRNSQLNNRKKAFEATPNLFLHNLSKRNLVDAKLEVFKIISMVDVFLGRTTVKQQVEEGKLVKVADSTIYRFDSLSKRHILYSELPLLVFNKNVLNYFRNPFIDYNYMFSKIDLPNQYAVFTDNGFISGPNGITFYYQWGNEGLASALPENYIVPSELSNDTVEPLIQMVFETNPTNDTLNFNSSGIKSNQTIGYEKSLIQTSESDKNDFVKPDFAFKPSELEKGMDIFTLLKRIPGLRVTQNMETGDYSISLSGSNTNLGQNANQDNTPALLFNNRIFSGRREVMSVLEFIETNRITEIGLVKYGNGAMMGARGGAGTIIIKTE